jgi:hypothetical protein
LLPDAKAMGKTIETHVDLHIQKLKGFSYVDAEAERLRDKLIAQALDKASQPKKKEFVRIEKKAKIRRGKLKIIRVIKAF